MAYSVLEQNTRGITLPLALPRDQATWNQFIATLGYLLQIGQSAQSRPASSATALQYATLFSSTLPALRTSNCTVTADNSWFLFGGYSYKVAVSGASAYVELGASGYPLVMPPNQQWLISFYGKCSAASQKFNAGLVTATGTYQVACYTDATAGNVTRFAFPLNLVADNNSAATFRIDIPSSSSDNFWFDGFQFEPAVSNTVNPSPFLLTNIIAGSIIADNISVSNLAALSANMGTLTAGKIQSADGYFTVDCTNELITIKDGAGTVRMQLGQISAGVYDIKIWDASSNLLFDAASGLTYTGNTSAVKSVVAATPDSNLSYLQHGTVYDLHIGGVKVDTLTDNVYARPLATALTTGQVDLSKAGVVNKTLANISDSGSRFAVINAAGQKGVSAVDAANKALIDFSQVGHTNKILDNIDDGTYYTRMGSQTGAGVAAITNALFQQFDGTNFPGWNPGPYTVTLAQGSASPSPAYGTYYCKLTSTSSTDPQLYTNQSFKCKSGDVIQFGGVVYNLSAASAAIMVIFYNAAGTAVQSTFAASSTAAWVDITGQATAPSTAAYYNVVLTEVVSTSGQTACFNDAWATNLNTNIIDLSNPQHQNALVDYLGGVQAGTCYDGLAVTFNPAFSTAPLLIFGAGGLTYSSATGSATSQSQQFNAGSLTASGFTASLKLVSGGSTTAQSNSFTAVTAGAEYHATLASAPATSPANQYTVNFAVTVTGGAPTVYIRETSIGGTILYQRSYGVAQSGSKSITVSWSGATSTSVIDISIVTGGGDTGTISASTVTYTTGTAPSSVAAVTSVNPITWLAYPA